MNRRNLLLGLSSLPAAWRERVGTLFPSIRTPVHSLGATNAQGDAGPEPHVDRAPDIRKLTQHFITRDFSPWIFVPEGNIKSLSTTEHPGFATISHLDKGQDIKGILKDPIKIHDYPLPWEFHLGIAGETYMRPFNQAVGLNLALTFSDPSSWPKDRTQLPPNTHSFQLLNAHLRGPQIESGPLNYYAPPYLVPDGIRDGHGGDPYVKPSTPRKTGEVWVLYGRGDLDPSVMGDWRIPYNWIGWPNGLWPDHPGGLQSHSLNFRVKLVNPTTVEVGFFGGLQGEPHLGWRMRTIDVSRFGKITGIWEIGPIVSLDHWLAEDLPKDLGINIAPPFAVSDPSNIYMVDYAVFFGASAENYDHFSDDFDIPGFSSPKFYHEAGAITDTYTHPGYLTVTLLPQALAIWAMTPSAYGTGQIDLTKDFPGYEVEVGWIPPDAEIFPWKNFFTSFSMWTESGKSVGYGTPAGGGWTPGVEYDPKERRYKFFSSYNLDGSPIKQLNLEFKPEVPQSILGHKPIYMLLQIPDASHLRMGFRASTKGPWYLSKPFDVTTVFGEKLGKIDPLVAFWGGVSDGEDGAAKGIGNYPHYPQFLIDFVHFRKGISTAR